MEVWQCWGALSHFPEAGELAAAGGSAGGARAPKACAPRQQCDVHRTGRVSRTQRGVPRRLRPVAYLDAVLTLSVIRRQKSAPQNIRGDPAPHPTGPQARAQATHQRKLLANQQPRPRLPLASSLQTTSTWKVYARWILLGHGYTGQCSFKLRNATAIGFFSKVCDQLH